MRALHRNHLIAREHHDGVLRLRKPGADLPLVWTQVRKRIAMAALCDQISLGRGHVSLLLQEWLGPNYIFIWKALWSRKR